MPTNEMSFTTQVPPDLVESLKLVTETTGRSQAYIGEQALREYLLREADFISSVKEGLAAAERGEFATDEEMEAVFEEFCGPSKNGGQK